MNLDAFILVENDKKWTKIKSYANKSIYHIIFRDVYNNITYALIVRLMPMY